MFGNTPVVSCKVATVNPNSVLELPAIRQQVASVEKIDVVYVVYVVLSALYMHLCSGTSLVRCLSDERAVFHVLDFTRFRCSRKRCLSSKCGLSKSKMSVANGGSVAVPSYVIGVSYG